MPEKMGKPNQLPGHSNKPNTREGMSGDGMGDKMKKSKGTGGTNASGSFPMPKKKGVNT